MSGTRAIRVVAAAVLLVTGTGCAVQYGETRYETGGIRTRYAHWDIGRNVAAASGGAESYAVIEQDEARSFRNLANLIGTMAAIEAAKDVAISEEDTARTGIKESAKTDRAGIDSATTLGVEREATIRALEAPLP